jgi:pimeloyl-ACP methyl ester carboxylesterase
MAVLTTDAVDIAYDDVGSGDTAIVCIHGFSCARTDFVHQMAHFSGSHRVVAFDQRGHGESSVARDGRYGFDVNADDAATLCAALGIERPVVVGHSLGGVSAIELARRPGFASALVLLDSTVDLPLDLHAELAAYNDRLEAMDDEAFRQEVSRFARVRMVDPCDDPAIVDPLMTRAAAVRKDIYVAGARSIVGHDVATMARQVEVPALFIASSLPWLAPQRVHEVCPSWFLGRTVGAGHFHHLLVPDQVNAMVEQFLAVVAAGFTSTAESPW